jgi:hypothetical protein
MSTSLILAANDQSYDAWLAANKGATHYTRIDVSEYFLYARLNGEWVYIAPKA